MAGHPRRRKIRKVIAYICTGCYKTFPNGSEALAHYRTSHPAAKASVTGRRRGRPGKRRGRRRGRR